MAIITTAFALSAFSTSSPVVNVVQDDPRKKNIISDNSNNSNINDPSLGHHITTTSHALFDTTGDILDPTSQVTSGKRIAIDPMKYLRTFSYGRVSTNSAGDTSTTIREFTLIASDDKIMEVSPGVFYNVWTFNGTIPGPTIRATEGDLVRIHFVNNGSKPHSIHFHGIHRSEMDGVFDMVSPGGQFVYEFYAEPFGVFPYHCHMQPLEEHISHGLYGVYIVDPKNKPRPTADEMVMVMNGYDTDSDKENNFYTVNGIPYYYMHHPIQIEKGRLVRVYLVNMLEFDPINNFHLHANMYQLYRSGTSLTPDEYTDMVTMSQGERGILEFTYKYPGPYMFHAHKTEFAEKGWMGTFLVKDENKSMNESNSVKSIANNLQPLVGRGSD
ncbi:MAG: multicopper oxidase domain-containing protein [Nitrososphaeraceae archaeon]